MVCERQTLEHLSGLAKSLETPTSVWTCLSLHFLTAQSRVAGRSDRPRIHSSDRSSMSSHLCVTPRQTDHMPEKDFIRGVHFPNTKSVALRFHMVLCRGVALLAQVHRLFVNTRNYFGAFQRVWMNLMRESSTTHYSCCLFQ